jgi:hypothetical protein
MRRERKELTTIKFCGPSFEDHGLEIDILPELVHYKRILIETTKELWRRNHPDRERIPKGFESTIRIKFYDLREGSTAVPLYRMAQDEEEQLSLGFDEEDELDQAVEVVECGLQSAYEDRPLPDAFPRAVMPMFESLGKTLGEKDFLQMKSPKRENPAVFTSQVRERLITMVDRTYEDAVDLVGEVRLADLDGLNFTIRLDDGTKVQGKFDREQEPMIIEALSNHGSSYLRIKGRGQFTHQEATIKKVIKVDYVDVIPVGAVNHDETAKPVWELISEIRAEVPEKDWDQLPTDLSKELDHYLYGTPRSGQ